MKRILPVVLALFILLTLPVCAASGKVSASAAYADDSVTITLHLDNPGIIATLVKVRYDAAVLTLVSAENGDIFPNNYAQFGKDYTNNPYNMTWLDAYRRDNVTKSGTLGKVTFRIKGGTESGKTTVRFDVDRSNTFDVDMNDVQVGGCSCSVNVPVAQTSAAQTTQKPVAGTTTTVQKPVGTTKPTTTKPAAGTTAPTTTGSTKPAVTAAQGTTSAPRFTTVSDKTSAPTLPGAETTKPVFTIPAAVSEAISNGAAAASSALDQKESAAAQESIVASSIRDAIADDVLTDTVQEQTESAQPTDPQTQTNRRNLLWLLLLIPAAVAVVLLVRKKEK